MLCDRRKPEVHLHSSLWKVHVLHFLSVDNLRCCAGRLNRESWPLHTFRRKVPRLEAHPGVGATHVSEPSYGLTDEPVIRLGITRRFTAR